ncbi:DUF502 domain-containing protein [Microscilla marina]|uniref:Hypothetical conserved protein n=1 Tax=Microscilla marina ATCC 23134 TaxID=313606 RepID=A1ZKT1_MICM2|nr:DUF502 domain-containing protein [Microscilla marina]EAY28897.1 hypothetical conserved protein [Microscilla marina ATCC 23134]
MFIFKRLIRYFLQGLLFVVPIFFTAYAVYFVFTFSINYTLSAIRLTKRYTYLPVEVHFLVYVAIDLVALVIIGYLASGFITKAMFKWFNQLLFRIPIIRIIYSSLQGFTSAFVGSKRKFDRPVLVKMNPSNLERVGFMVQDDLSRLHLAGKVAVYLPGSYGISGTLVIALAENVKPLDTSGLDAMNFIISGGIADLEGFRIR